MKSKSNFLTFLIGIFLIFFCNFALAEGSVMAWDKNFLEILDSVSGPLSKVFGAIAILLVGFKFAFGGSSSEAMKKALWAVIGLTIAFGALDWGLDWLGYGGGAVL